MIRYLRGLVREKVRQQLIVDVNGVGYDVYVTPKVLTQSPLDEEYAFHISESIREDAHDLYGFREREERDAFDLLRKVSGVGPKVALAIVGFYSPEALAGLINANDATKLSLVPGIGKKLASKIIVELKDKAASLESLASAADDDTVAALTALGYGPAEIAHAMTRLPANITVTQEKVTWILRHLVD